MHLQVARPGGRMILPDHVLPDALCIPYWRFDIRRSLESCAVEAARHVGVILVGPEDGETEPFIAAQPDPARFGRVRAIYDSPWLRDHAPIAVRDGDRLRLVRPRRPETERKRDPALFGEILAEDAPVTPAAIAAGNLVSGPEGLALSTPAILDENETGDPEVLAETARLLGIRDWLIVPAFADERSRHTDTMVRFLAPDLAAVAARGDIGAEAETARQIVAELSAARPGLRVVQLPAEAGENGFNSPLNWLQFGRVLLVPDYGDRPDVLAAMVGELRHLGFDPVPIPTDTAGLGGGLHCLTASVHAP